jgi:hypothetical protein
MGYCEAHRIPILLTVLLIVLCPTIARAEAAEVSLKDLVARSGLIVIARVAAVEDGPAGIKTEGNGAFPPLRVATAEVIEVWKGGPLREVRYIASPVQNCDVSHADEGERVVLFLGSRTDTPIREISHLGRGRMPIRQIEGKPYATIDTKVVQLPEQIVTIPGPEPRYSWYRSVKLNDLRQFVRQRDR